MDYLYKSSIYLLWQQIQVRLYNGSNLFLICGCVIVTVLYMYLRVTSRILRELWVWFVSHVTCLTSGSELAATSSHQMKSADGRRAAGQRCFSLSSDFMFPIPFSFATYSLIFNAKSFMHHVDTLGERWVFAARLHLYLQIAFGFEVKCA